MKGDGLHTAWPPGSLTHSSGKKREGRIELGKRNIKKKGEKECSACSYGNNSWFS